jgi:hypothetical protein
MGANSDNAIRVSAKTAAAVSRFRTKVLTIGMGALPKGIKPPSGVSISEYIALAVELAERSLRAKT